jgi:hypothetical protein
LDGAEALGGGDQAAEEDVVWVGGREGGREGGVRGVVQPEAVRDMEGEKRRGGVGRKTSTGQRRRVTPMNEEKEGGRGGRGGREGGREGGRGRTLLTGCLVEHPSLDRGSQKIVGGGDGVDVSGQVQIELLHGHHLSIPA